MTSTLARLQAWRPDDCWLHFNPNTIGEALFSRGQRYRYALSRRRTDGVVDGGTALWIGLNPSSADAFVTDPTVTRESRRTFAWGFTTYVKVNAYALVSTDPKRLALDADPVGAINDSVIEDLAERADVIVLAWGAGLLDWHRRDEIEAFTRRHDHKTVCLGTTKGGEPRHPLYLPNSATPLRWPSLTACTITNGEIS